MPALRLAAPTDAHASEDDATEVTRTDVVDGAFAPFVDPELVEEGPVAEALRAPFGGGDPERTAPVVSVVIIDEEDDHWDEPEPEESGGLELRVLRSELLRLRQDLDELRSEREAALQEVMAASAEAREAHQELADWRAVAERAEARVAQLTAEVAHYRAFADSGLWSRMRGCDPYAPPV